MYIYIHTLRRANRLMNRKKIERKKEKKPGVGAESGWWT